MLDKETKRRIDDARNILVGKIPDPKSQVEQITIALIYKFMDDMDKESEEFGGERSFFVGEFERFSWTKIFDPKLSGFDTINLYSEAIERLDKNPNIPQFFRDIFKNAFLPYRDPETLKLFLKTINEFQYDHSERLGDAFEYLLSVLGSQGDAGQFRTPRHIIDFMVDVVQPKKNETICDPACGTAGFLISAYKHILAENTKRQKGDMFTPEERTRLMKNFIGYDISPDMVRLSLVNMFLHGFQQPHILEYDTLTSEDRWDETFDVVLANPPFMSPKGGIRPHKRFTIQANRSEVLFLDYIAEHINPTSGRAGVIVPEGIIFQSSNAYKDLRKILVEDKFLYAVVSLPAGVFQPYSGVKTSILLMDKSLAKQSDKILFVKIENDGFGLGAQRKEQQTSELPDAVNLIEDFQTAIRSKDFSKFEEDAVLPLQAAAVEKERIAENGDFNLSGDRYKVNLQKYTKFEIIDLSEVAEIGAGNSAPQDEDFFIDGKYPFFRTSDVGAVHISPNLTVARDQLNDRGIRGLKLFKKNTILFPKSGASTFLNHRAMLGVDGYVSSHLATIKPKKDEILPLFLFHLLKEIDARDLTNDINYPSLKISDVMEIKIPLPPLTVQQEIVDKIESFQRIFNGAKQVIENYEPQIEILPDWDVVDFGDISDFKNGINYTKNSDGEFVKVLGVRDFKTNFYAPLDSFDTVQIDGGLAENYYLQPNDIVFVRSNGNQDLIGRSVIIPEVDFKATFSGFTIRQRFLTDKADPLFFAYLLKTEDVRRKLINSGTGANIKSLNQTSLNELKLPLPPLEAQHEIVIQIEKEKKLVNANKELIKIYEQKIKDEINRLWEEE
jgi:type I restriction enzyme M protein